RRGDRVGAVARHEGPPPGAPAPGGAGDRPRHRPRALTPSTGPAPADRAIARDPGAGTARAAWAARSWPQAASMSTPRVRRTVALTPRAASRSRNARTRPGGVPRTG